MNTTLDLDQKQQRMVIIVANTAVGNLEQLKEEFNAGLEAGLTVNQIKEILVQLYAYPGFPSNFQGINTFVCRYFWTGCVDVSRTRISNYFRFS